MLSLNSNIIPLELTCNSIMNAYITNIYAYNMLSLNGIIINFQFQGTLACASVLFLEHVEQHTFSELQEGLSLY